MPRMPLDHGCCCHHDVPIIIKDQGDQKLLILENKLVPKDLSGIEETSSIGDNTYIYIDDNGNPRRIKAKEVSSRVQSDWSQSDTTAVDYIKNKPSIPTKTSELTNDSGFLTEHQSLAAYRTSAAQDVIDNALDSRVNVLEGKEASWDAKQDAISDLATIRSGAALGATAVQPAAISDMATQTWVVNQGFITKSVSDLANYYKKTETYTQAEVNSLIAKIKTIEFKIVEELPTQGETNYIYLVKKQGKEYYEEYIWITGHGWEKIGETEIDLSNYYKKSEVDNLIAGKQDVISDLDNIRTKANSALQPNDNISKLTNDAGYLTEHQSLAAYRTSTAQDAIDANKQDKLTAGNAIDLTNNVAAVKYDNDTITLNSDGKLVANGAKLKAALTANQTVGGVSSGTIFVAGTALEEIIKQILYVEQTLQSISITTPPTKTAYTVGETFSTAGMVITAQYNTGSDKVTGYTYSPTGALTTADTKVTISYTYDGVTKTAEQAITVTEPVTTVDIYYGGIGSEEEQIEPEEFTEAELDTVGTHQTISKSELIGSHQYTINPAVIGSDDKRCPAFIIPKGCSVSAWQDTTGTFSYDYELNSLTNYNAYFIRNFGNLATPYLISVSED